MFRFECDPTRITQKEQEFARAFALCDVIQDPGIPGNKNAGLDLHGKTAGDFGRKEQETGFRLHRAAQIDRRCRAFGNGQVRPQKNVVQGYLDRKSTR